MSIRNGAKWHLSTAVASALLAGLIQAGTPARAQDSWVSPNPRLSGYWEPRDATGAGTFGGVFKVPKAQLVPTFVPPPRSNAKDWAYGAQPPIDGTACRTLAFPFYLTSSPPWEIVQTKDAILILTEREMGSRHIYMDGRGHPAHVEPTSNGDSIGHWEGQTLVVDTVSFRWGMNVPGGGSRGPNTHVVERYTVVDDPKNGTELQVNFTWDDPTIYAKPHEYTITYYKMPKDTYALEDWCDGGDPKDYESAEGIVVIGKGSIYNTPEGRKLNEAGQGGGPGTTPKTPPEK